MEPAARKQLVLNFVEHCTHSLAWGSDMVLQQQSLHPDAIDTLDVLSRQDPDEFLSVLLDIIHTSQREEVMIHASGPLEMLLETEPDRVISQVEALAVRDSTFRELLSWFGPSEPHSEVWTRVRKVAGEVPW